MTTRKDIEEWCDERELDLLCADDLDDAFMGYIEVFHGEPIALYDREKCIEVLAKKIAVEQAEDPEEPWDDAYTMAVEWFDFNVQGAYVGEQTPAFATLMEQQ